jgi:hypothetical protein
VIRIHVRYVSITKPQHKPERHACDRSDIQKLWQHVKHADVFVLTCVPCVIVAGAGGLIQKNVVAVGGCGRPARCATCACRWRRGLRDEGAAVFTGRSLLCRGHRDRCDLNTHVPLRSDALMGNRCEGRVDRRIGGCPAPRNVSLPDATSIHDPTTFARSGS